MSSSPTDQVAVTLTGEEWTTITGGLSRHGSRFYRQATAKLREQLLAASDAAQSAPPATVSRKNPRHAIRFLEEEVKEVLKCLLHPFRRFRLRRCGRG